MFEFVVQTFESLNNTITQIHRLILTFLGLGCSASEYVTKRSRAPVYLPLLGRKYRGTWQEFCKHLFTIVPLIYSQIYARQNNRPRNNYLKVQQW